MRWNRYVVNAATQWINQYRNGVGGHPIQIDRCVTNGEPGKSLDTERGVWAGRAAAEAEVTRSRARAGGSRPTPAGPVHGA